MLLGGLSHIDQFVRYPGWEILYQAPIACLAVYFGLMQQVENRPVGGQLWALVAKMGLGATLVFQAFLWIIPGLIGLVLALVAMYVVVMVAVDKLLGVHLEHAHTVTSTVCVGAWLLWLIVGGAITVIGAL